EPGIIRCLKCHQCVLNFRIHHRKSARRGGVDQVLKELFVGLSRLRTHDNSARSEEAEQSLYRLWVRRSTGQLRGYARQRLVGSSAADDSVKDSLLTVGRGLSG